MKNQTTNATLYYGQFVIKREEKAVTFVEHFETEPNELGLLKAMANNGFLDQFDKQYYQELIDGQPGLVMFNQNAEVYEFILPIDSEGEMVEVYDIHHEEYDDGLPCEVQDDAEFKGILEKLIKALTDDDKPMSQALVEVLQSLGGGV